ncbi:hypothetical protein [Candidatus Villigracilis affinis]|uniref:hypothetical protein n=1 Tax=Candidatus Villigracilis affinis TaxID=3140682 RepID=UPI002A1DE454|nr:hypothetical protein [Anaerolineales bacterium]
MIIAKEKDEPHFYNVFQKLQHPTRPLRVFYIVTCIHFLITILLMTVSKFIDSSSNFLFSIPFFFFALIAPGYLLLNIFSTFFRIFELLTTIDGTFPFLWILASSPIYGIVGGLIVSESKILYLTGLILVGLLIIVGFYVALIFMMSTIIT